MLELIIFGIGFFCADIIVADSVTKCYQNKS